MIPLGESTPVWMMDGDEMQKGRRIPMGKEWCWRVSGGLIRPRMEGAV
jgi:hypothetical protein